MKILVKRNNTILDKTRNNTIPSKIIIGKLKLEVIELKQLIQDIIETLDGRDDSIKSWIEERLNDINNL